MIDIVLMANISTHGNNNTKISKMFETKAMTGISHHLLLVLSVAAIMVMCMCLTPSLNIAQAQTANQSSSSSSSSNAPSSSPTTATKQQGNVSNAALTNITGSIHIGSTISSAISSKVKTNLSDAVTIAQKAVGTNTSATLAFIRPLNGYLVYDVHVRNNSNNTTTAVIVDAGNGKVLYKQSPPSLVFGFGFGSDHYGIFGKGKMGPFFGGHSGIGRGGFSHHGGGMMMGQSPHIGEWALHLSDGDKYIVPNVGH